MKDFGTKANQSGGNDTGTATKWGANESNSMTDELKLAVEQTGQTLTVYSGAADPNTDMLAKAMVITSQTAHSYTDGGAADAYVLTKTGSLEQPDGYVSGEKVTFTTANPNTGASTVNKSGLGVKAILSPLGAALVGGEIRASVEIEIVYNGTAYVMSPWNYGLMAQNNLLHVQDQKAQNTAGGGFTLGAWRTRVLNTTASNSITNASLLSDQITLPAGKYYIEASAPAIGVTRHQAVLYNITDAVIELVGTPEYTLSTDSVTTESNITGEFTIVASKVFELQHQCSVTRAVDGFGIEANFTTEIYSDVKIWKVG